MAPDTTLNGNTGGTGLSGNWTVGTAAVESANLTYGSLTTSASANVETNNDGVENGVAWALGAADPSANAIGLLPTLDNTSDPTYVITP